MFVFDGVSPPWYKSEIERMAFNLYAMEQEGLLNEEEEEEEEVVDADERTVVL